MKTSLKSLRKAVFMVIQPDLAGYWPSIVFDLAITALIFLSVASVFIVTLDLSVAVRGVLVG